MRRRLISLALILIDAVIVVAVTYLALFIRFDGNVQSRYSEILKFYLPMVIVIRLITFHCFGLYHRLWRYASIRELLAIISAVTVGSMLIILITYALHLNMPRTVYIASWVLNILFIGVSRLFIRIQAEMRHIPDNGQSRVLIIGAGSAGVMVAREIQHHYCDFKKLVGFIDDDLYKQGQLLLGFKVLGNRTDLKQIVKEHNVDEMIIAIPSVGGEQLRQIIQECRKTGCRVKLLPDLKEMIDHKSSLEQLRNVHLEDLLCRNPIQLDQSQLAGFLQGKRVLITGAGGSIGSELCRQVARFHPNTLVLLGKGENSVYEIDQELRSQYLDLDIEPVIADVRDRQRIRSIFFRFRPEVVFHAAAHKHVPLMEVHPIEAVRNNIFGTKIVAEAAQTFGTGVFVMISTDKAVNPTSVMGTTKRVAEQIIQSLNGDGRTKYVAVRFGNVLGSRGSVVPLFQKQIASGGPVTVTHAEMKRYFMTIPEAAQLVLEAGSMAEGGEVFVLDMGEPVKIYDMACTLIELSGLRPHQDIKIKFTGLRPGEKLFEELLSAEEGIAATTHEKIFRANLQAIDTQRLKYGLELLRQARFPEEIKSILTGLVPTYIGYQPEQVANGVQTTVPTRLQVVPVPELAVAGLNEKFDH